MMDSAELMHQSFAALMERVSALVKESIAANATGGITSPKGEGSLFLHAHEHIVDLSKESLPATINRLVDGLDAISGNFFDGKSGIYAAMEAARALDHLKEATILSCCVDPNIRRALQIGLWAAELATTAKHRYAETAYSIGIAMQENQKRGSDATRKKKPSREEFTKVLNQARATHSKEAKVVAEVGRVFGVGKSKVNEWKHEYGLTTRSKKN